MSLIIAASYRHVWRFPLWCIAMPVAFVVACAWTFPSAFILIAWGSYRRWDVLDHQDWMMPYYPIEWCNSMFDAPNKAFVP